VSRWHRTASLVFVLFAATLATPAMARSVHFGVHAKLKSHVSKFGAQLATSADGRIVVASADCSPHGGELFVYERPRHGWHNSRRPSAVLTASPAHPSAGLGNACGFVTTTEREIAISADGSTIVAGDPVNDHGGNGKGAVYVFVRPGKHWHSEHEAEYFQGSNQPGEELGSDIDELGDAVAVSGNGGVVVASAPGYMSNPPGRIIDGMEAIYMRGSAGWSHTNPFPVARIYGPDNDAIGPVAISRPGSTIVVGGGSNVLLYDEPPGGWGSKPLGPNAVLSPSTGQLQGVWNLAISPSADTILVGATNEVAFVFSRAGEEAQLTPPHGSTAKDYSPQFGFNVGLAGRIAVVGTNGGGADRLFVRHGSRWSSQRGGKAIVIPGEPLATGPPLALSDTGQLVVGYDSTGLPVIVLQPK
jgi:hypothetical protein